MAPVMAGRQLARRTFSWPRTASRSSLLVVYQHSVSRLRIHNGANAEFRGRVIPNLGRDGAGLTGNGWRTSMIGSDPRPGYPPDRTERGERRAPDPLWPAS